MDITLRPATEAEAKALASTVRLRVIRLCRDEPLTNKQIAQRLGIHPATALHHVRTLVAAGFLAPQPPRRGARGSREVPYRSTRKSWQVGIYANGDPDQSTMFEALCHDVRLIDTDDARQIQLGLRLTKEHVEEFRERLTGLLDEYARRTPDAHGRTYSVVVSIRPNVASD